MSRFDRFMVYVNIGRDEKLARLTDAERLCHIAGVLALAAKSPVRGRLLVGDLEASPREVGRMAAVSDRVAKSTIEKLAAVGILIRDEEYGCWRVHNWEKFNPEPRVDNTGAERQARYRERLQAQGQRRSISGRVKEQVMERDDGRCVVCGSDGSLEFHHRIRVVDGGGNDVENLELRCTPCHRDAHKTVTSRRHAAPVTAPEVEEEGKDVFGSPVVCGRASAGDRAVPLSIDDERRALADHIVGVLQRGVDGLTTDEGCKRPTRAAVLNALGDAPRLRALAAAADAREIAQSQNRAPNIVALFAQRLSQASSTNEAAA